MTFASWRKCDFQIHTPRDPNWIGARPVGENEIILGTNSQATIQDVETERRKWAEGFVDSCIAKGLDAIAITDHHEMVMIPYVQDTISAKKSVDSSFDLWLFPGMELTAHGGVQCLILFDADLSLEWRQQAQVHLGIVSVEINEKSAKAGALVQLTHNYADISCKLDEIEQLRGKYIILPNVSQGNSHTVLKDGAHADFLRMPYIGGYLDKGQTIDTLGTKNRRRISGNDKKWSNKFVYPLPTTDSRNSNFNTLGTNNTWIKLAEPTAEAIRQAFLSHQSRISITHPETPSLSISSISLDGSTILKPFTLDISPELNSIIGGRGSGKSSFLEYLAFGLGRSSYDLQREHFSGTGRMSDLINDTFVSKMGNVILKVSQDGAIFEVIRSTENAYQPHIIYPNGETQTITVKELRSLFPAVVYSQGELAELGKKTGKNTKLSELLQFVDHNYKQADDQLLSDIEAAKNGVKKSIHTLIESWILQAKLRKKLTAKQSIKQRIIALEKTLPELDEEDKSKVAIFEKSSELDVKRVRASDHTAQIMDSLNSLSSELLHQREFSDATGTAIEPFEEKYNSLYRTFAEGINQLIIDVKSEYSLLKQTEEQWVEELSRTKETRDSILEKFSEHKTVTTQISKLRDELAEVDQEIGNLETKQLSYNDPSRLLRETIAKLHETNKTRILKTQEWAQEIEALSGGKIKAIVEENGNISEIREALDYVAAKTGSQESTRLKALDETISGGEPIENLLDTLRTECMSVMYWQLVGSTMGEEKPATTKLFDLIGNADRVKSSLMDVMDTSRIEMISTALSKPEITLSYCDRNREISFEKASEGQRAAALLFMLLEQSGGPLVIDQPEGDLDNKIISDLTDALHDAKKKRQIVFVSHNANIVVNGSSEFVGYLDVEQDGSRQFGCSGAIDSQKIREVITSTMEGGEKAFKDRQSKYGF